MYRESSGADGTRPERDQAIGGSLVAQNIPLSRGYVATVDDADFERLSEWNWFADVRPHTVYAYRNKRVDEQINGKKGKIYLHRQVLDLIGDRAQVDHINRNGLDNRQCNLRVCSGSQNQGNKRQSTGRSSHKGVGWHKAKKRWRAYLTVNRKHIHLGLFPTEAEAARAYDRAALGRWGEFALLNFPADKPPFGTSSPP
jgi:hypothetical protein